MIRLPSGAVCSVQEIIPTGSALHITSLLNSLSPTGMPARSSSVPSPRSVNTWS